MLWMSYSIKAFKSMKTLQKKERINDINKRESLLMWMFSTSAKV